MTSNSFLAARGGKVLIFASRQMLKAFFPALR